MVESAREHPGGNRNRRLDLLWTHGRYCLVTSEHRCLCTIISRAWSILYESAVKREDIVPPTPRWRILFVGFRQLAVANPRVLASSRHKCWHVLSWGSYLTFVLRPQSLPHLLARQAWRRDAPRSERADTHYRICRMGGVNNQRGHNGAGL